ncbi:MAG: hypothetical protein N2645_01910 [Clostridia bacterium]|nr:hypothetical protein [Clostridia bacterium]
MKKIRILLLFTLIGIMTLTSSCMMPNLSTAKADPGKFEGNTYKNDYFGLSLQIPKDWSIQDEAAKKELTEKGKEAIAGDDEKKKKALDSSDAKTLNLVVAFKYPQNQEPLGTFNSNFMSVAEKISLLTGTKVKTGKDYFKYARKLLESTQIPYNFDKEMYTETVGGKKFDVMEVNVDVNGVTLYQKYYCRIIKSYALVFITSYSTEDQLDETSKILQTVKFK